jgi:hypothetical protein
MPDSLEVANGVPSETAEAKTNDGTTSAKSIASRDECSDSLRLLCSDTTNLHNDVVANV